MWTRRLSEIAAVAAISMAVAPAVAAPPPAANEDPFAEYRERFKQGMDRYKAGAFTEAIGYWEPIYSELGQQKGYRLAYNLGVAYQELGDATRAAEHLQTFLAQVDATRAGGGSLPAIVQKEEADARDRIASLTASKGRIHVDPGTPPRATQVDGMEPRVAAFVAWVNPGQHTITFGPGAASAETRTVEVRAGQQLDVAPSPAPPPPVPRGDIATAAPAPAPLPAASGSPAGSSDPSLANTPAGHPFPAAILYVAGGLAVAAGVASIPLEVNAWSLRNRATSESPVGASDGSGFYSARTWAYGTIGTAVGLAIVTAGLTTWYFLGSSGREVAITPGGITGRF